MLGGKTRLISLFVLAAMTASTAASAAGDHGTADEAIALVKKAKTYLSSNPKDKAFAEISRRDGPFVDRDLYVTVYDTKGNCLAHGANAKLIGQNLAENQDVDGKYYIKERLELAAAKPSFWQDYKITNPTSKKIEPKSMYCEKGGDDVVCAGIYK